MELKEFVREVLTEIIDAVQESQAYAKEKGAIIAPGKKLRYVEENREEFYENDSDIGPSNIEFNLLLTDKNTNGGGGKIGVSFGILGAGYKSDNTTQSEQTTNVSFNVPIFYPRQE